jgi:hypothetical protein
MAMMEGPSAADGPDGTGCMLLLAADAPTSVVVDALLLVSQVRVGGLVSIVQC